VGTLRTLSDVIDPVILPIPLGGNGTKNPYFFTITTHHAANKKNATAEYDKYHRGYYLVTYKKKTKNKNTRSTSMDNDNGNGSSYIKAGISTSTSVKPATITTSNSTKLQIWDFVTGFDWLVYNGKSLVDDDSTSSTSNRALRTVIGLDYNSDLILFVVDGCEYW